MGDRRTIIDHTHPAYIRARDRIGKSRWNGAYYYSKEICEFIIPKIETDRNWITINIHKEQVGCDHAIVIIHNHFHPERYEWLKKYDDLILVCAAEQDMEELGHLGKTIFLPLSIDVEYVRQFIRPKTREIGYAGRLEKKGKLPPEADIISKMERKEFLSTLATYRKVYCVDRVELEAKVLGCEVLHNNIPSFAPEEVIDIRDAAVMLQKALEEIDE